MQLGVPLSHSVLDFPNKFCRNRNEPVLSGFLLALTLEPKLPPRFGLNVQRAFFPIKVGVFRVLHFGIPNTGIQEQTVEQFLLVVHGCKHVLELLLRIRLRGLLNIVKFRQNLAAEKSVPSPQPRVERLKDVMDSAVIKVAFVVSQKLLVPEKLVAIDLVYEPQVVLDSEVEEESEAVVVCPQRLLALALLVFSLKELKLGEPLIDSVRDLRSTSFVLILNNWHVCVESFEVCLLALSGGDRFVEIVANRFPRTGAVSQRIPQEVRTSETGGTAPTSEIDLLIAPSLALADLAIECDCHIASCLLNTARRQMIGIW